MTPPSQTTAKRRAATKSAKISRKQHCEIIRQKMQVFRERRVRKGQGTFKNAIDAANRFWLRGAAVAPNFRTPKPRRDALIGHGQIQLTPLSRIHAKWWPILSSAKWRCRVIPSGSTNGAMFSAKIRASIPRRSVQKAKTLNPRLGLAATHWILVDAGQSRKIRTVATDPSLILVNFEAFLQSKNKFLKEAIEKRKFVMKRARKCKKQPLPRVKYMRGYDGGSAYVHTRSL